MKRRPQAHSLAQRAAESRPGQRNEVTRKDGSARVYDAPNSHFGIIRNLQQHKSQIIQLHEQRRLSEGDASCFKLLIVYEGVWFYFRAKTIDSSLSLYEAAVVLCSVEALQLQLRV